MPSWSHSGRLQAAPACSRSFPCADRNTAAGFTKCTPHPSSDGVQGTRNADGRRAPALTAFQGQARARSLRFRRRCGRRPLALHRRRLVQRLVLEHAVASAHGLHDPNPAHWRPRRRLLGVDDDGASRRPGARRHRHRRQVGRAHGQLRVRLGERRQSLVQLRQQVRAVPRQQRRRPDDVVNTQHVRLGATRNLEGRREGGAG